MKLSSSLQARLELKALREQVDRMASEHRSKKASEFDVAYFAASFRISNLEALNERSSVVCADGGRDGVSSGPRGHQAGR